MIGFDILSPSLGLIFINITFYGSIFIHIHKRRVIVPGFEMLTARVADVALLVVGNLIIFMSAGDTVFVVLGIAVDLESTELHWVGVDRAVGLGVV
jgi:hypothetical protein